MPNAVITGATQGIGKAIAEMFLSKGFSIAIYARTQEDLDQVKSDWKNRFPDARIICRKVDAASQKDVEIFGMDVIKQFGQVDVLVNNVGIFLQGRLMDEPEGQLENLMQVNFYSAYYLTRMIVPSMKEQKTGHIFNICSVASLKAYNNGGAYGVTKYALLGFSENLRQELKGDKIKVTALMPGATWSRSWEGSQAAEEKMMLPSDVAKMIWAAFELSPAANVESIVMRPLGGDV